MALGIAHGRYLLTGWCASTDRPSPYYLVAYLLMTLLSFGGPDGGARQTGDTIEDFNGTRPASPFLAFAMLIAMASLAGVPFTAGSGEILSSTPLSRIINHADCRGVITVACGFYYYFKVVRAMYWEAHGAEAPVPLSGLARGLWQE